MKTAIILLIIILVFSSCKNDIVRNKNIIVKDPVTYLTTHEIAEKLIGRYEVEDDPQIYFEIKSNGEIEISLSFFPEFSKSESRTYSFIDSENLLLTAFYTEEYYDYENEYVVPGMTHICFQLINSDRSFPGGNFAIEFKGDFDCTYFVSITYYRDGYLKFIKVN
jgi:hypothetical protein